MTTGTVNATAAAPFGCGVINAQLTATRMPSMSRHPTTCAPVDVPRIANA